MTAAPSRRRSRAVLTLAGALVPLLALAACTTGTSSDGASSPAAGGPRLTVMLQQFRDDVVTHRLLTTVLLTSTSPVTVQRVRLVWSGLPDLTAAPDYPLMPGVPVDLALPYRSATCSPDPAHAAPPPKGPSVVLTVDDRGTRRDLTVPAADPDGVAGRLYRDDCRRQAVEDVVTLRLSGPWQPVVVGGVPAGQGFLVLTRTSSRAPVRVTATGAAEVLLDLRPAPGTALPATLPAGATELRVPVLVISTGRCDPHALSESKTPFLLYVKVDPGDGRPTPVLVQPSATDRPGLYARELLACHVTPG